MRPGLEHLNESETASELQRLTRIVRLDCVKTSLVESDGEDRGVLSMSSAAASTYAFSAICAKRYA